MNPQKTYGKPLVWLLSASFIVRLILAATLELGNDEVYYWTYALYPDLSHFDHPPMVGWMIQLFTFNLALDHEVFIRLAPVILGTLNTYLVFLIGRAIRDAYTGWLAALLYTASIYAFIIAGTFILPDTPQMFYWLIGLYFLLEAFNPNRPWNSRKVQILMAGMAIGLAMLSKYTSVFLWIGAGAYILVHERRWLRSGYLYVAVLISLIFIVPVIQWNIRNEFISFTFHSGRVGLFDTGFNINTLLTEILGQVFYNNPVNYLVIILTLVAIFRGKLRLGSHIVFPLLYIALPLILLFVFFAMFRRTLPHWTGPAYTTLLLVAAAFLAESSKGWLKRLPGIAVGLVLLISVLGLIQVQTGLFWSSGRTGQTQLGRDDVTLDMYGWKQIGQHFEGLERKYVQEGWVAEDSPIVTYRWFPAAHLDYYVAQPLGKTVLASGSLDQIHKYAWINQYRGGFRYGSDAWFITTSRDFADVHALYGEYYKQITAVDTLAVTRSGRVVEYAFFYTMTGMKKLPGTPF